MNPDVAHREPAVQASRYLTRTRTGRNHHLVSPDVALVGRHTHQRAPVVVQWTDDLSTEEHARTLRRADARNASAATTG